MSTRSPMNKRTQAVQAGEVAGYKRKSAGSAKPARQAAASVRVVPASAKAKREQIERGESLEGLTREEKRARKRERRMLEDRLYAASGELLKDDPNYKPRRRFFWVLLGIGLFATIAVWVMLFVGDTKQAGVPEYVLLGVAYAAIIASFIYDLVRIRPLRNDARARAEGMSDKKLDELLEAAAAKSVKKK